MLMINFTRKFQVSSYSAEYNTFIKRKNGRNNDFENQWKKNLLRILYFNRIKKF